MEKKAHLDRVYKVSDDVVAREIQGEFILIPVTSGIADMEDEIFALNETGKAIWHRLDGTRTLKEVVEDLSLEFSGSTENIRNDALGLVGELLKRKMVV